jgi:hypothetical protein
MGNVSSHIWRLCNHVSLIVGIRFGLTTLNTGLTVAVAVAGALNIAGMSPYVDCSGPSPVLIGWVGGHYVVGTSVRDLAYTISL